MTGTPATLNIGELVTYTAVVRNGGPAGATFVRLTDAFPVQMDLVSATATQGTCSQEPVPPRNVVCEIGSVGVGGSVTAVISARPRSAGTITNAVQAVGAEADPAPVNNVAVTTTTVRAAVGGQPPPPPPPPPPPGEPPPAPPPQCIVPKLKGLKLKAVKKKLRAAHCKLGKVKRKYSKHVRKGRVLSQKPKAGSILAIQAPVRVTLSRGRRPTSHK